MNLTEDSPVDDTQPAFSPDGESIAFRSEREGGGIFLMGATGESVRRLTDFGYNPAWSPDGEEIVLATATVGNRPNKLSVSKLWSLNLTSGARRLVTEDDAAQPCWSPNGSRIGYWTLLGESSQRDIWTIPAKGGDAVPVTEDLHVDWNPVWSPDGTHLYFSSDRGGSMNLWRVPIDEESGRVLGPPEAVTTGGSASRHHLDFSKDGMRIVYVEQAATESIWKVAFNSSSGQAEEEPIPVTKGSSSLGIGGISPDGRWLTLFGSRGQHDQDDIFIMRTDGTGLRQLTDGLYKDRGPVWSPDGTKIAFYSDRSGSYEIHTIHPDGSGLQQLTVTPDEILSSHPWSPDGLQMAYYNYTEGTSYLFDLTKPWQEQTPEPLPPFENGQERFDASSWSPDGRKIAGFARTAAGYTGVVIYSLESQQYQRLTDFSGGRVLWLSDGHRLLFNDDGAVYLVDVESREVQEVFSFSSERVTSIALSPDNRWIFFNRQSTEADIWMLTFNEARE
jgi:Tol biopolymer transport system component